MANDKDKTVIGGKLPTAEELRNLSAGRPASPPAGLQQPPAAPPAGGGQRTVIGGGLPQSPPPAAPYTPQPPQGGFANLIANAIQHTRAGVRHWRGQPGRLFPDHAKPGAGTGCPHRTEDRAA